MKKNIRSLGGDFLTHTVYYVVYQTRVLLLFTLKVIFTDRYFLLLLKYSCTVLRTALLYTVYTHTTTWGCTPPTDYRTMITMQTDRRPRDATTGVR